MAQYNDNDATQFVQDSQYSAPQAPIVMKQDAPEAAEPPKKSSKGAFAAGAAAGVLIGALGGMIMTPTANAADTSNLGDQSLFGEDGDQNADGANANGLSDALNLGEGGIVNNGTINIYTNGEQPVDTHHHHHTHSDTVDVLRTIHHYHQPTIHEVVDTHIHVAHVHHHDISFGDAFAMARAEVGPGGVFEWHGNVYSTYTAEEWNSLTPQERTDFNNHFAWNQINNVHSDTNPIDLYVAGHIHDDMSFSEAFAAARAEVGSGGVFEWHGHLYNTYTSSEWNSMSLQERHDFTNLAMGHHHDGTSVYSDDVLLAEEPVFDDVEIEVLGVDYDPTIDADYAALSVDGDEVLLVDVDDYNDGYDVMVTGDEDHIEIYDISDTGITADDVLAYEDYSSSEEVYDDYSTNSDLTFDEYSSNDDVNYDDFGSSDLYEA